MRNNALVRQHGGVRERALDVEFGQAVIETDRRGVAFNALGDGFGKAPGPELGGVLRRVGHNRKPGE
jgi:hypothetical protein